MISSENRAASKSRSDAIDRYAQLTQSPGPAPGFLFARSRHKSAMTPATRRGIIGCMESRIPDFGDVLGLTRLYRQTIENVRSMDIP